MSRCAGCLRELGTEPRVVADTEVFHRGCVQLVGKSLSNRLRHKVVALQQENARLTADASGAAQLRVRIDDANRDARNIAAERDRLQRELRDLRTATATAQNSGAYWEDRCQRLEREKESLMGQLEAARRELALHQTIQGKQATTGTAATIETAPSPKGPDGKSLDDTEVRFSLLELDSDT